MQGGRAAGRWAWGLVAAMAAAAFVHRGALAAPFFADDWLFLEAARGRSLVAALLARDPLGNFFRPLGRAGWFWLVGHASGESPAVFHVANLALFLIAIALLWALARKLAGDAVAAIAAAILALTCAADVPVLWACGAQDLLAVVLALTALLAAAHDRRALACVCLLLAPLAKETVALASLPALLLARRAQEPWRATLARAWWYPAMTLAWVAAAAFAFAHARVSGSALAWTPAGPIAAAVALARTALGLEWSGEHLPYVPFSWPPAEVLAALLAVTLSVGFFAPGWPARVGAPAPIPAPVRGKRRGSAAPAAAPVRPAAAARLASDADLARTRIVAIALMAAGTLPVAAVAPIWSAYYLLFAMCGVALLAGALLARQARGTTTVVVVALGLAAQQARAVEEFAQTPSPWSAQSHVNRFYLERGMTESARIIAELRSALPHPAPHTTVLLAGIPAWVAVQTSDGPVIRGVYRDSTLRSYFLSQFEPWMLERGPVRLVFTTSEHPQLRDHTDEPDAWSRAAYGMLFDDRIASADAALAEGLREQPTDAYSVYARIWTSYAIGARARADSLARLSHLVPGVGADALLRAARERLAARDTLGAVRVLRDARGAFGYDAEVHGLIADVLMRIAETRDEGTIEAFAAHALAPDDGVAWRRWGYVQMMQARDGSALASLRRYEALAPAIAAHDELEQRWRETLEARVPGGRLAQRALHSVP